MYYGVSAGSASAPISGGISATLADLQIQINNKLSKISGILTGASLSVSPALGDNSLAVASTEFVDRAIKVSAPGYVLMAMNIT